MLSSTDGQPWMHPYEVASVAFPNRSAAETDRVCAMPAVDRGVSGVVGLGSGDSVPGVTSSSTSGICTTAPADTVVAETS